jgi:hypothetical protein
MEHQRERRRADAEDQRRPVRSRLARGITRKLLGLPPMKNLRFMIYDLRLTSQNGRRGEIFSNHQSSIINHKLLVPSIVSVVPK